MTVNYVDVLGYGLAADRPAATLYLGYYLAKDTGDLAHSNGVTWASLGTITVPGGSVGVTGSRPASPVKGQQYFDTTLDQPVWYDGSGWIDATGTTA